MKFTALTVLILQNDVIIVLRRIVFQYIFDTVYLAY